MSYNVYPLLSVNDRNFDVNKIGYEKIKEINNDTYDYIRYQCKYEYDRVGKDKFCLLTNYLNIENRPKFYEPADKKISMNITLNDKNTKIKIQEIIKKILTDMKELYKSPNNKNNVMQLPIILNKNEEITECENMSAELTTYNDKKNNKKICTSKIHFHKSKKNGGGTVTIKNDSLKETYENIMKEMTLFKNKKYNDSDIFYQGKFVFCFNIDVRISKITHITTIYVKINIVEMEVKHNVSNVKSIFDNDLIYVSESKNGSIQSLIL